MEYSLEYGFLRLSQTTRQRLNIPVMVVTLGELYTTHLKKKKTNLEDSPQWLLLTFSFLFFFFFN